jgi:hypothetical protein
MACGCVDHGGQWVDLERFSWACESQTHAPSPGPCKKERRDLAGPPLGLSGVWFLPQAASGSDPAAAKETESGGGQAES